MCIYPNTSHRVCLDCRVSVKLPASRSSARCPRCRRGMIDAGSHLAVPRKLNGAGWRVLTTVLGSGLTFHGGCCGQGPGYRPRTLFEVRERLNLAERRGIPVAVALAMEDTAVAGS